MPVEAELFSPLSQSIAWHSIVFFLRLLAIRLTSMRFETAQKTWTKYSERRIVPYKPMDVIPRSKMLKPMAYPAMRAPIRPKERTMLNVALKGFTLNGFLAGQSKTWVELKLTGDCVADLLSISMIRSEVFPTPWVFSSLLVILNCDFAIWSRHLRSGSTTPRSNAGCEIVCSSKMSLEPLLPPHCKFVDPFCESCGCLGVVGVERRDESASVDAAEDQVDIWSSGFPEDRQGRCVCLLRGCTWLSAGGVIYRASVDPIVLPCGSAPKELLRNVLIDSMFKEVSVMP